MGAPLHDLGEQAAALPSGLRQRIEQRWTEATKVFSAHGLDRYVGGAVAPQVAREVGEDAVAELASAALRLASKTSGAVIERVLSTAPTAARRLADAALFLQYLQFLGTLAAQAPRGLRPMLGRLDTLLGQFSLGGLRRWAHWGVQAHRTQPEELTAYFDLQSRESLAMLQQERKGTLLVDVQRRIQMYLRALWGRDFYLRPTAADFEQREGARPFIEDGIIHLPDAYDAVEGPAGTVAAAELYRAAAAHAAAHLVFTRQSSSAEGLTPWQMALIGVVEDARVEALALARFPGLRPLWARLHTVTPTAEPRPRGIGWTDWRAR